MRGPACDSHRRGLVEHILCAASLAGVPMKREAVEGLDPPDLAKLANAADPVVRRFTEDDGWGVATFGQDFMQGVREEVAEDFRRVGEAAQLSTEERRARGPRRVATTITEDQLGRWWISRRPTTRPGQLARPRARRSSTGRRRGSRRGTGNRAGSGDDPDDGGEPEPASRGHLRGDRVAAAELRRAA